MKAEFSKMRIPLFFKLQSLTPITNVIIMEKRIIAQISVQQPNIAEFLKLAKIMVAHSNAEPGCIEYRLLNEVDKETEFLFHEKYTNEAAIEHHNASEHFLTFVSAIAPFLAKEPIIEVF